MKNSANNLTEGRLKSFMVYKYALIDQGKKNNALIGFRKGRIKLLDANSIELKHNESLCSNYPLFGHLNNRSIGLIKQSPIQIISRRNRRKNLSN